MKQRVGSFDEAGLLMAIELGEEEIVDFMLAEGIGPDAKDGDGRSTLLLAVEYEQPQILQKLLSAGASPNLADRKGSTPLLRAIEKGNRDVTDLLVRKGADVNAADLQERTPLMKAAVKGSTRFTEILLDNDAELDRQDEHGKTALIHSTRAKRIGIVKLLLQAGANPHLHDESGHIALDYTGQIPHLELLLREAMARVEPPPGEVRHASKEEVVYHIRKLVDLFATQSKVSIREADATQVDLEAIWEEIRQLFLSIVATLEVKEKLEELQSALTLDEPYRENLRTEIIWFLELLVELRNIGSAIWDISRQPAFSDNGLNPYQSRLTLTVAGLSAFLEQVAAQQREATPGPAMQPQVQLDQALMEAASIGNEAIVDHLLKAGADIYARNGEGKNALDLAVGYPQVMKMLLQHEAGEIGMDDDSWEEEEETEFNFTSEPTTSAN